jgi:hypothetical protein
MELSSALPHFSKSQIGAFIYNMLGVNALSANGLNMRRFTLLPLAVQIWEICLVLVGKELFLKNK